MTKTVAVAVVSALVGALVVFGYFRFTPPPPGLANSCPGSPKHCIEVSVITAGKKPQIDAIPAYKFEGTAAPIFWKIVTHGYTFPIDGILFDKETNDPTTPEVFPDCGRQANGTFMCKNTKKYDGTFGYTVRLDGSAPVAPLDPFIINR